MIDHGGWLAAALLCAAGSMVSRSARADAAEVLRPSTRAAWYAAGVGPSIGLRGCGKGGCNNFDGGFGGLSQFHFTNEVGWHFSRDGHGPAIGGIALLGFGGHRGGVRFSPQFKFWWDIPVVKRYAIYLTPGASAGYGFVTAGGFFEHFFSTQITFAGRLVLKDRGIVFLQPITADITANGDGVGFNFNIIGGGGVTFP